MPLKLLTPSEVRDSSAQDASREALRLVELKKATDAARKNLANAELDFARMLAGQRERWLKEEEEHGKDVAERTRELAVLEEKRRRALEPIEAIKREAEEALQKAQNDIQNAEDRENEAQRLSELLEDKLDAVGAREIDITRREQKVEVMERNAVAQQAIVDKNSERVRDAFALLELENIKAREERAEKERGLILRERSLDAREEKLNAKEKRLEDFDIRLKDERATLDRIYIRTGIKKKQG